MQSWMQLAGAAAMGASPRMAAAARAFFGVLVFGVTILLVVFVSYQMVIDTRARQRAGMRRRIRDAVGRVVASGNPVAVNSIGIPGRTDLFNRRGMGLLLHVFDEMNDDGKAALRAMLIRIGYGNYAHKQLGSDNEDFLAEVVRMVAELQLKDLDGKVAALLYSHKENVELQYQAFMTLSRLGSAEHLVQVCMDKDFVQTLSFRSLQQILAAFTGDRHQLYAHLLSAPDHYVVRICIKRIGAENMVDLAPEVEHWLDSEDMNLVIDSVRALGTLQYRPAAGRIAQLLGHERWEVRSVAVTALAAIDLDGSEDAFVQALQDNEWQVRYNAGTALRGAQDPDELKRKVQATGDKYALEMLEYMMQTAEIWRSA